MTQPLEIPAEQARRFLVRRHLLDPPRSLPADPASVLQVVERLGSLQFDPLEVPGARNHDLVLHARIGGFRRDWTDQWLYGPDRRLIEVYNKSLNILPITELPHYRLAWERADAYYRDRILSEQSAVAEAILAEIDRSGPLPTSAFRDHTHAIDWWWAPTSAARAVMEALFVTGRLGIARREGNRRFYDLMERLVPAALLERREPEEDALKHRLWSRYRAVGLMASPGPPDVTYGTGSAAQRRQWTAELEEAGVLRAVQVEGLKGTRYLPAEEEPLLQEAATRPAHPGVTFLAPLDPFVWDRRLLRDLFGFDYLWEVYVPEKKRRWGYYVLPILFGDRLVGRIEPRLERATRTLRILHVWFEPGFGPMEEPDFVSALADALEAYRSFVGARTVTWPRTRPGRDLAGALRRVAGSAT
ncbi:MAG TPA: crosslink repair DNA glycosylase YcaQ family protein [candidate division Zixibacteria bacterium]|nr:crosslink repair DNA glycosylase YcaQ family protein [candidate division Zixibacteria bacterium]